MKTRMISILLLGTFVLAGCSSEGDSTPAVTADQVDFKLNQYVTEPPALTSTACDSSAMEIGSTFYALKGVIREEREDGEGEEIRYAIAPDTHAKASIELRTVYNGDYTFITSEPEGENPDSWWEKDGIKMVEPHVGWTSSLHAVGTIIPIEMDLRIGEPMRGEVYLNGELLGTCSF